MISKFTKKILIGITGSFLFLLGGVQAKKAVNRWSIVNILFLNCMTSQEIISPLQISKYWRQAAHVSNFFNIGCNKKCTFTIANKINCFLLIVKLSPLLGATKFLCSVKKVINQPLWKSVLMCNLNYNQTQLLQLRL